MTADAREVFQELVEGMTCLDIVDQVLERHSAPDEDGNAAENLRIAVHDRLFAHREPPTKTAVVYKVTLPPDSQKDTAGAAPKARAGRGTDSRRG